MPPTTAIIDFDGTLTERDGDLVIAETLLGPAKIGAYHAIAAAYERLELSTQQFFLRYLELLQVDDPGAAIASAAAAVVLRPGARELLASCRNTGVSVIIASEGLDAYVVPALRAGGISDAVVRCNRLAGRTSVLPAQGAEPCDRCLSCKAGHARRAREAGHKVVVVGDGASDLCAARLADLVIARGSLCAHCKREGLAHEPWDALSDVARLLQEFVDDDSQARSRSGSRRPLPSGT